MNNKMEQTVEELLDRMSNMLTEQHKAIVNLKECVADLHKNYSSDIEYIGAEVQEIAHQVNNMYDVINQSDNP